MALTETLKTRRGHTFYPDLKNIPDLYDQDGKGKEAVAYIHYFCAAGDWWITEVDKATGQAFGWADLGYGGEFGYIPLPELEQVLQHHGLVIVERDLDFKPTPLNKIPAVTQ